MNDVVSLAYDIRCPRCKCMQRIDEQSLTCISLREHWRRATVVSVKLKRQTREGKVGTRRDVTWLCPRCGWVHSRAEFVPDAIQQMPLDGLR